MNENSSFCCKKSGVGVAQTTVTVCFPCHTDGDDQRWDSCYKLLIVHGITSQRRQERAEFSCNMLRGHLMETIQPVILAIVCQRTEQRVKHQHFGYANSIITHHLPCNWPQPATLSFVPFNKWRWSIILERHLKSLRGETETPESGAQEGRLKKEIGQILRIYISSWDPACSFMNSVMDICFLTYLSFPTKPWCTK